MFRRILVPLDGSSRAERAFPVAALLVRASHGSVILIRVTDMATEHWPALRMQSKLVETIVEADLEEAKAYLAQVITSPFFHGLPVEAIVQFGPAAPTLLQAISSSAIDLVVMCSHGSTGMIHALMGSVAQRVSQHATVPVFILREGGPVPAGPHPDALQPLRALVGLDGSDYAKGAILPTIALISALAAPAQGAIHLLHVVKPSDHHHLDRQQREQVIEHAKDSLHKTIEEIREEGKTAAVSGLEPQFTWSVALGSDVAETLIRVAESGEDAQGSGTFGRCDIIALSTHGHNDLSRWAMGSVVERVLGATQLPMLIVRPQQMKTSAPRHLDGQHREPFPSWKSLLSLDSCL